MGVGFTFGGCKQSGLRDGWVSHVEDVRDEFERTGKCPSVVPSEVAMLDGTLYTPHPFAFDTSGPETDAIALFTANESSLYLDLDVKTKAGDLSCADARNAYSSQFDEYLDPLPLLQDEISVFMRGAIFRDRVEILPLFAGSSEAVGGGGVSSDGYHWGFESTLLFQVGPPAWGSPLAATATYDRLTGSYMWLCIESVTQDDPYAFYGTTASWVGAIFFHVEKWDDGRGMDEPPLDVFINLSEIACSSAEDAYDEEYIWAYFSEGKYWNWSQDCDGFDNDLDGVVDEYPLVPTYAELDGNGVPDCLDDWDGDGIQNHEDESMGSP